MGIYDRDYNDQRYSEVKKTRVFGIRTSSNLMNLIFANITVFILLYFLYVIYLITGSTEAVFRSDVLNLFSLPGDFSSFIHKPWSLITFMFMHFEPGAIFSNMLWLWAFGSILEELQAGKTLATYIYGSLAGAVIYLTVNSIFHPAVFIPFSNGFYGGAAGVMAVAIAATVHNADYRLFPNIGRGLPLWVMTLFYVTISLATMPFNYFLILLGGIITGVVMTWSLKNGRDLGAPLENFFDRVLNLFNPDKNKKKSLRKQQLQYVSKGDPYQKTPNVNQLKIDEILDKINRDGGTHNLSKEEKDILRRAGEEL